MRVYIALLLSISTFSSYAVCQCTFPSDLSGNWYSSAKGLLNITSGSTSTVIYSYNTIKFGALDLTCNHSSGSQYVFQSPAFSYLGLQFRVYVCFYLANVVSSSKYIYYLGSVENTDADNERLKTPLVSLSYDPSISNVCDRTSYSAGTEHIFLKNDGLEANSRTAFPFDMRGTWYYNFTSSSTTTCGTNSSANICTASDTSTVTYGYTLCSTVQAYSATGVLYNMWYSSDTSYTYIHVYNTDSTTDESTTYRFTCYVVSVSGTTIYASQYPQSCQSSQTPTSVSSPGATIVFAQIESCPYDTSSTVISTASAVGITLGVFFIIILAVCAGLIYYYYKKRKQREALDKLPLQKAQPANKRLNNGDLFRDSKSRGSRWRDSKTPGTMNGDIKINMDTDPSIRRENSICISVTTSRGGSGIGLDEKVGPAPVEEPEKVNYFSDDIIEESDHELTLASTFLPISPSDRNKLNYSDNEIKEIEERDAMAKDAEEMDDMDAIDDELGLPRLSRAFTPVHHPDPLEPPTLPIIDYKKDPDESYDDRTGDGVLKVKLKGKKKRVRSAKQNIKGRPKSSPSKPKRETPFLERIKKQEVEKVDMQQRQKIDKEMKDINNGDIKARLPTTSENQNPAPGDKYLVDHKRDDRVRTADRRALKTASGEHQRRRFGDPIPESARANRKRTPRIRHPMEVQKNSEETEEKGEELQKTDKFWRDEKLRRSGRSRKHPEARTIPSVKEDPIDHNERPPATSAYSQARSRKSAVGSGMERENSAFIDLGSPNDDNLWSKASNMWHFKNQPVWGNLAHKH